MEVVLVYVHKVYQQMRRFRPLHLLNTIFKANLSLVSNWAFLPLIFICRRVFLHVWFLLLLIFSESMHIGVVFFRRDSVHFLRLEHSRPYLVDYCLLGSPLLVFGSYFGTEGIQGRLFRIVRGTAFDRRLNMQSGGWRHDSIIFQNQNIVTSFLLLYFTRAPLNRVFYNPICKVSLLTDCLRKLR